MHTVTLQAANDIVAGWRAGETLNGWENPAGPLFTSGKYAEHELTLGATCSGCTSRSCAWQTLVHVECC